MPHSPDGDILELYADEEALSEGETQPEEQGMEIDEEALLKEEHPLILRVHTPAPKG